MFRFPKGLLDESEIEPYLRGDFITFETAGSYQVLDINYNPDDGGEMEEMAADLSDFIHLREDLLQGDFRLLYLAWLLGNDDTTGAFDVEFEDDEDEEEESELDGEEDAEGEDLEPPGPASG